MAFIKVIETTNFEFDNIRLNDYYAKKDNTYTALKWANEPIEQDGKMYIQVDERVYDICENIIEIELIVNNDEI